MCVYTALSSTSVHRTGFPSNVCSSLKIVYIYSYIYIYIEREREREREREVIIVRLQKIRETV